MWELYRWAKIEWLGLGGHPDCDLWWGYCEISYHVSHWLFLVCVVIPWASGMWHYSSVELITTIWRVYSGVTVTLSPGWGGVPGTPGCPETGCVARQGKNHREYFNS